MKQQDYLDAFNQAFKGYTEGRNRPGYSFGFLSSYRHSTNLYPHIVLLKKNLEKAKDSDDANSILHQYFKSPRTKFNNHSFSLYLIDAITSNAKSTLDGWEQYYPRDKEIKFFNGTVYRGTLQTPQSARERGITSSRPDKQPNFVEEYVCVKTGYVGVSTSTNIAIGRLYQTSTYAGGPLGAIYETGYLYKINYRGIGGVHVGHSLNYRSNNKSIYFNKDEVNIIGKISWQDVEGYWDKHNKWYSNEDYNKNYPLPEKLSLSKRLSILFNPFINTFSLEKNLYDSKQSGEVSEISKDVAEIQADLIKLGQVKKCEEIPGLGDEPIEEDKQNDVVVTGSFLEVVIPRSCNESFAATQSARAELSLELAKSIVNHQPQDIKDQWELRVYKALARVRGCDVIVVDEKQTLKITLETKETEPKPSSIFIKRNKEGSFEFLKPFDLHQTSVEEIVVGKTISESMLGTQRYGAFPLKPTTLQKQDKLVSPLNSSTTTSSA